MTIKDTAGRVAALAALAELVEQELKTAKRELDTEQREHGLKQVAAEMPDGAPVAKVSWVSPGAKATVMDEQAFLDWVVKHHPHQVERRFVTEVREAFTKALLKEMTAAGVAQWCDKSTGELHSVPGVELVGRAAFQRLTWADGAKDAVVEAWRSGSWRSDALLGRALPELEGGE